MNETPLPGKVTQAVMHTMSLKYRPPSIKHSLTAVMYFLLWWTIALPVYSDPSFKKATLMPLWEPQAQFAGYYVALDKGIYAKHGIDLTILRAGPGHSPVDTLRKGAADFAILWLTSALRHCAAEIPLVNLAQTNQRSSMMLIAKKTSRINTIADMDGKKVGLWEGDVSIPPRALFAKHHIRIHAIRQSHTVNLFLRGGIDVTSAMWFNEYHTIINSGIDPEELNVFFLRDQGMNLLEDGIYALQNTVYHDPELAAAFVEASLQGWRYAFAHPGEAIDIVIKYMHEAHLPANRVHQRWMLDRMRDQITPADTQTKLGELREQDYEVVGRAMQEQGLIEDYPDYNVFVWRPNGEEK